MRSITRTLSAIWILAGLLWFPCRLLAREMPNGLSLSPSESASEDAKLRAAILSVHAYVEKERADGPLAARLAHVTPMPLEEAAAIIHKAPGPQGDMHRRRALLRLLSWVRDKPEVGKAVTTLVGSAETAARIYRMLSAGEHGVGCQQDDPQVIVNNVVNEVLQAVTYGQCDEIEMMAASVVSVGDNVGVSSRMIARGPLQGARAGLDAQRWDDCSGLWGKAYIVKVKSNGDIEQDTNGMAAEGTAVTPYGGSYDTVSLKRPFFEQFTCDGDNCDVRLLLHVATVVPPTSTSTTLATSLPAYFLKYNEPKQWQNSPFPNEDRGTISVDAEDLPSGGSNKRLTVTGDKVFGFTDWTTNFAIYFMLRRIEMASYLADLVCCRNP